MPKLLLAVEAFNLICLVNDVDQVSNFGDTPENFVDPDAKFPIAIHISVFQLAYVGVGSVIIVLIKPREGFEDDKLVTIVPEQLSGHLKGNRTVELFLSGNIPAIWEDLELWFNKTCDFKFRCG